ncbi:hypothetical protein EPA93_43285 [Ktedonosporobacter rubrisoli]|uniref:Type IV secretion system protein n=1 Tax=Ktedonosporobacter rubrisoli TaxID=2509675 RepID=A0A4P6K3S4_KTERU|nr:hypothetical protein [Ktedonosporobacter rubrisoli]QBD82440.1 hypothetical protein EPA93_43285 [Ktedonosporobacter rubrisoli]
MKYSRSLLPDALFLAVLLLFLLLGLFLGLLSSFYGWTFGVEVHHFLAYIPRVFSSLQSASIVDQLADLAQQVIQWLGRQGSILWYTDPQATYNNDNVKEIWSVVLAVSDSTVGIFIALAGYQIILGGYGPRYVSALEELPRLIFSAIGANISLIFAQFWIELNNLLCTVILAQIKIPPLSTLSAIVPVVATSIVLLPLVFLLIVLVVILAIQMAVRLAIIILLIVCMPALFLMLANRHTAAIGQSGIMSYISAVFSQTLQVTVIILGINVLLPFVMASFGQSTALAPLANLVAGIALLWVTLRIPGMLRSWALQPVAESGQVASRLIFGSITQFVFFNPKKI